jgi:hypothetical protein
MQIVPHWKIDKKTNRKNDLWLALNPEKTSDKRRTANY